MTGTEYVREEDGAGYIFATAVRCGGDCEAHILYGDMEPEFLFVDGVRVMLSALFSSSLFTCACPLVEDEEGSISSCIAS